jgi:hypothetical protein
MYERFKAFYTTLPAGQRSARPFFHLSGIRCVDGSICTVFQLNAYTTKTCLLHVSSIK